MKKTISVLSIILCLMIVFAACAANTSPDDGSESQSSGQFENSVTSDSNSTDSSKETDDTKDEVKIVKIYNGGQLLSVLENSKNDNYAETSKNTVYQLQTDIDLNEGWSAEVITDGDVLVTAPQIPGNVWTGIKKFSGTLDGNGHTIKGVYMTANLESNSTMGFIGELCGGTIKNLTIENSFICANVNGEAENVYIGALVGSVNINSVIENVTVNVDMYISGNDSAVASGTVAKKADGVLVETELNFNGNIFRNSEDTSVIRVSTAQELLDAIAANGDFDGKTLKLTADIDLNPTWSASVTVGDTAVQFPTAPENVFPSISTFKGTLDGNGHTISGIYAVRTVSGGTGNYGGLFGTLDGGKIMNLVIRNSFMMAENTSWGSKNIHVGGIAGNVKNNASIVNLYSDMEVWYKSNEQACLGGIFGFADGVYSIDGLVFEGCVGNTNNALAVNYDTTTVNSTKDMFIGQIIGNQNWKSNCTMTNALVIGTIHSGNTKYVKTYVGADDKLTIRTSLSSKENEEYLTANTDYNDAGWVYSSSLEYIIPASVRDLL